MSDENDAVVGALNAVDVDSIEFKGKFFEQLNRNNKKIKRDRAVAITEAAQKIFKREIEDMQDDIKELQRDKQNMLDLSPTTADSLVLASDFEAKDFVERTLEIGIKIRNLAIRLEVAKADYKYLFGE